MKEPKNILVFSWRDPKHPLAGGAEQVMHEHMKGWIKSGFEVTLFSSKIGDLPSEEILDGVRIIRRGSQYLGVQIAGFFHYMKHSSEYDLVVDQFHGIPFFTTLYVKKPILAVLQEVAKEVWFLNHLPFPVNRIVGFIGYFIEPFVFKAYKKTKFMTGSNSAKEDLIAFGIDKNNITVVPHGVKLVLPKKPPEKEKDKTVIFLGALAKDKGVEDAIDAFSLLPKDYKMWIVGKGSEEYLAYLKHKIKHLDIEERTKFFGFVTQEEKFILLAKAHVLVNPSIREGWGLVNIEANSVGTPVVAYHSPGLVDSVKDRFSGILLKKNNPSELARVINLLFDNEIMLKNLCRGAQEWSDQFHWSKAKEDSIRLIGSVIV